MGYDYKVEKGNELIIDVTTFRKGNKQVSRSFKLPVEKGDEIYYEFYIKDGELSDR